MENNKTWLMLLAALGVVVNIAFGTTVQMLKIPLLFLDTMGTIFVAATLGPFWGALTGLATNTLQGLLTNPVDIPFALVNMTIGLIVGFAAWRFGFNLFVSLITGIILAIVAPLVGTPIAVWIYGGLTGGGTDFLVAWLLKSGQSIFTAAFLPRILGNFIDKIASCLIAYLVIKKLPVNIKERLSTYAKV
jgi:energy-coupling factor transport system substrate-specific component